MAKPAIIAAIAGSIAMAACSPAAQAPEPLTGEWSVDGDASHLSYVSVKAGEIAESNRFSGLSGTVSADGKAEIKVDLATVDTGIEIRDGRMRDILFNIAQNPVAKLTAQIDPASVEGLAIGDSVVRQLDVTVNLKGIENTVPAEMQIIRAAEDRVLAVSTAPVILDARSFELGDGLEQLRQLANLPSISPAVPVTFSIAFER